MAYAFYMGDMRLPMPPSQLKTKIKNQNKTITLINEGEMNILKRAGLTEVSFTALLPNVAYPFASYDSGFKDASYFLSELERIKQSMKPIRFIVSRVLPNGTPLYSSNMQVALEDWEITEESKNGFDVVVDIKLKQAPDYGTKTVELKTATTTTPQTAQVTTPRAADPPQRTEYTVVKGDSFWAIAKRFLGSGSRWKEIYEINQHIGKSLNPGEVLTIPSTDELIKLTDAWKKYGA